MEPPWRKPFPEQIHAVLPPGDVPKGNYRPKRKTGGGGKPKPRSDARALKKRGKSGFSASFLPELPFDWPVACGWAPGGRRFFQRFQHGKRVLGRAPRARAAPRSRRQEPWGKDRARGSAPPGGAPPGRGRADRAARDRPRRPRRDRSRLEWRGMVRWPVSGASARPWAEPEICAGFHRRDARDGGQRDHAGLHDIGFEMAAIGIFVRARARQLDHCLEGIDRIDAQPMCDSGPFGRAGARDTSTARSRTVPRSKGALKGTPESLMASSLHSARDQNRRCLEAGPPHGPSTCPRADSI